MSTARPDKLDIRPLVEQMQAASSAPELDEDDRSNLLRMARNLVTALENPANKLMTISKWPVGHAALRVAFKIKLFELFNTDRATAEELALSCSVDHRLLVRILRALVCMGIFDEAGEKAYTHSALSKSLSNPTTRAMIRGMAETTDIMPQLPSFLASLEFRNPSDRHNSLFSYAHETQLNMYEWLQAHPEQMTIFNDYQAANAQLNQGSLQRILKYLLAPDSPNVAVVRPGEIEEEVLFVDVGGGRGEALKKFRRDMPINRGKVIVQDLPKVVGGLPVEYGVEAVAHDFFTPQPIKGAPIYFFRYIFHNWPTPTCREILLNTIPAMKPSTSRIVICDLLLPSTNAGVTETFADIQMMAFGGMERTEAQWRELLTGVGLVVRRFEGSIKGAQVPECLIEAVVEIRG